MSEIADNIIIKFGDRIWLDKLVSGDLFMQPLQYYRDLEEKELIKGQGDKYDGKLNLNVRNVKMYEIDDKSYINGFNLGENCTFTIEYKGDGEYLAACFYNVDIDRFVYLGKCDQYEYYKYDFTKEEKNIFGKWGDSALMIDKYSLINLINEKLNNIDRCYKKIRYYEPSNPYNEALYDYQMKSGNVDRLFWKDIFFKDQQEFRILIAQKDKKGKVVTNLGDISNFTRLESSRELLECGLIINVNK